MSCSSSSDARSSDDNGDVNSFSSSSSGSQEDAGDRQQSSFSDSDGAVFISSRSEIVISPRRRVGASTWDAIEPLLSGGGSGVLRRAERVSSARGSNRTRAKSSAAPTKSSSFKSTRVGSSSASARRALEQSSRRHRSDARGAKEAGQGSNKRTDRHQRRKISDGEQQDEEADIAASREEMSSTRDADAASTQSPAALAGGAIAGDGAGDDGGNGESSRVEPHQVRHEGAEDDEEHSDSTSGDEEEETKEEKPRTRSAKGQKVSESSTTGSSKRHERDATKTSMKDKMSKSSRSSKSERSSKLSRADKPHSATRGRDPSRKHSTVRPPSSPGSSRSPSPSKYRKPVSFNSETSYGEVAGVLPSPKEEMEELKQTLKKLASPSEKSTIGSAQAHGDASRSPSAAIASISDSRLRPLHSFENLQVASAAMQPPSPADQIRQGEFASQQPYANGISSKGRNSFTSQKGTLANGGGSGRSSRHASFDPASLEAKLRGQEPLGHVSSSRSKTTPGTESGGDGLYQSSTENRSSLNQRLFGEARDASSGVASYMPASNPASSSFGMQGVLGMGGGTGGTAQGSRAVLSALKALQDKIRRLEEERESLMQQLSDEKVKARKREAELASSEKKFSYELGQTKEAARAAYDAIRTEREELKVELVKTDERRRTSESEIQHFQDLMKTYAAKSDDLQAQLAASESERTRLQTEITNLTATSKRETQELIAKVKSLEQQQEASQEQIKLLDAQFQREASNHAETRERLHDSEQTVASISQLNEKLAARVWEATETANKATKVSKKQQRASAVSKTTAASRAGSASAAAGSAGSAGSAGLGSKRSATGGVSSRGNDSATSRSNKRSSVASGGVSSTSATATVAGKKGVVKKTKRRDPDAPRMEMGGANNMELLREANLGKEIPFLLGTSANQSFSIIGNVQDAIRQCDTTYVTPNTLTGEPIKIPRATMSRGVAPGSRRADRVPSSAHGQRTPTARRKGAKSSGATSTVSADILGVPPPPPSTTLLSDRTRGTGGTSSNKAEKRGATLSSIQVPPPPAPVSMHINPMQTQILDDLAAALQSAEDEFAALNDRYKDIVARMAAERNNATDEGGGRGSSAQLSSALGPLLDELEAKGKQVNLLRQVFQQASNSSINPLRRVVHSPEAIRRKTASLRLLNEYRQLERDARASPSHHRRYPHPLPQHSTSFFSDHEQF